MVELDGEAHVLRHLSGEAADDGKYEYRPEGDNRGEYVQEEPEQEPVHSCLAFTSRRTPPIVNRRSWLCLFGAVCESWEGTPSHVLHRAWTADLLDRDGFQDHRLRGTSKTWRVLWICPHLSRQEALERLCFSGAVEVEVDHHEPRVVHGTLDPLRPDTGLASGLGEPVERRYPRVEVGDRMLDVKCCHCVLLDVRVVVQNMATLHGPPSQVIGIFASHGPGSRARVPSFCDRDHRTFTSDRADISRLPHNDRRRPLLPARCARGDPARGQVRCVCLAPYRPGDRGRLCTPGGCALRAGAPASDPAQVPDGHQPLDATRRPGRSPARVDGRPSGAQPRLARNALSVWGDGCGVSGIPMPVRLLGFPLPLAKGRWGQIHMRG